MKTRHALLLASLVGAGWLAFLGDKTPSSGIAEPAQRTAPRIAEGSSDTPRASASAARKPGHDEQAASAILALQERESLIGGARLSGPAEGLFGSQNWTPPPPPPPKPPPPPPPTAPRLPFTYLGKKAENGSWEVYLARGDQTIIVQEKMVIDGVYRVDAIKPPTLSLTYLPLSQTQTLTIGDAD